ncbi:MAG: peptidylprolyl isomerase [Gammaproteobacteria bacterium]|nr:peptidylprolyl isomerase [Gammaproteobacteria bacterium]
MVIADQKVVSIHYTLKNDDGEVLDESASDEPLRYIHGIGSIIPGLEKQLAGKSPGDKLSVTVDPADAYGERSETLVQQLPRSAFQGVDEVQPGMQFQAQSGQGTALITVTKVEGEQVTVDGNHPLAGETLNFDIEVESVRDATAEELDHGHVHPSSSD